MTAIDEHTSSRTLQVGDDTIHYHDLGEGPALILNQAFGPLPGTTAWLTLHKILEPLAEHFRCIALDFPNYGRTSPKLINEPIHDVCARNAFSVMDHLGIESAPVLGVSMGATVAIDMALAAPERVERLVLGACHASTGGDPYLLAPFPSEMFRLYLEYQTSEPSVDKLRRLMEATLYDPELVTDELVRALYEWRVNEPVHNDTMQASNIVPHSNLADLHKITAPTLVVHGRFDRMVPYEQALMLGSYMTSADLVILNACGHWPSYERPAAYLRSVLPFLLAEA